MIYRAVLLLGLAAGLFAAAAFIVLALALASGSGAGWQSRHAEAARRGA